jgi:outer membrane protease
MMCSNRTWVCIALGVVLFAAAAASAVFADVSLTASTGTGVMYGLAKELVYNVHNNQSYVESELDWDIKPLFYTDAALTLRTSIGFVAALDVRLGIPAKTGSIGDSDYLNVAYNGTATKTNYSQHDSYTERAILLDAQAGWEFPLAGWMAIEPYLAFGFMDLKWTARDGYLQYPPGWFTGSPPQPYPDSSTQPMVPVSGVGIIYQQTYLIPALGLAAKFQLGKSFSGAVSFSLSPIVLCNDVDNHELAGKDFYDAMYGGLLLEPKISLDWKVAARVQLSLDVSYRHIEGLIGTTTVVATGVGHTPGLAAGTYPGGAGASFDALDASLDITVTL